MMDYEIGYRKPPKRSRFKPGVSGNPKGRRKRQQTPAAEIIRQAFSTPVPIIRNGRTRMTTYAEMIITALVERAVKGQIGAAEHILKVRAHAQRYGDAGVDWLQISDWLPDRPGQTAEQKTKEFLGGGDADPEAWWEEPQAKGRLKDAH